MFLFPWLYYGYRKLPPPKKIDFFSKSQKTPYFPTKGKLLVYGCFTTSMCRSCPLYLLSTVVWSSALIYVEEYYSTTPQNIYFSTFFSFRILKFSYASFAHDILQRILAIMNHTNNMAIWQFEFQKLCK